MTKQSRQGYNCLIKNIHTLVCSVHPPVVHHQVDLWIQNGRVAAVGADLAPPEFDFTDAEVIEGQHLLIYPGLINTHHHFFQAFVRNRVEFDWNTLGVIDWLRAIYPTFARVDEDCIYHASVVSMAELIKHGCTTAFDHQYNYSRHAGSYLVDRQIEAARMLGMRFHAGRGCNTLPASEGSTIPDAMCETTDAFISDLERLHRSFHDAEELAMERIVVAPCQPINAYRDTFTRSVELATALELSLHTHLGEGENAAMEQKYGQRTLAWCESIGFCGPNTWYAHGWELNQAEIARMAATATGLSHCPAPVYLVGAQITPVPTLYRHGVRLGLGVDGQASNDNSNLMETIRTAYLLQCLNAKRQNEALPPPDYYLWCATAGSAQCLNRDDLGELVPGMAGDLFAVDIHRLDYVGTLHDPLSLPAKVGIGGYVDLTVINGKVVWRAGEFPGLDEYRLQAQATEVAARLWRE